MPVDAGTISPVTPAIRPARWRRFVGVLFRVIVLLLVVAAALGVAWAVAYEVRTSALQSRVFSEWAGQLSYGIGVGPSPRIVFPAGGPFDDARGYSHLPEFQQRLTAAGYRISRQARVSPQLGALIREGISPPYPEPPVTGLVVRGAGGAPLYDAQRSYGVFEKFEDVPPLLAETLLFIENRELLSPPDPRNNPAIEWDRFAKAAALYVGRQIGFSLPLQGGSTLAIQLEKYRHSPEGRTDAPGEKMRQVVGASLKAYAGGTDTREWRRKVLVDYLNTAPFSAPPGYGEVHGFGEGLYAWFGLDFDDVIAALREPTTTPAKVRAYKHVVALIAALRAPTTYLRRDRAALESRVREYVRRLVDGGVIDAKFARQVADAPLIPPAPAEMRDAERFAGPKAVNAVRTGLLSLLGLHSYYDLDRLHLEVDSTIDVPLQLQLAQLLQDLGAPDFVARHGLKGEHLLQGADPTKVIYSMLLFEPTDQGNVLRAQVDNLDQPFDVNDGMKLELGSTAKLRTLAHYLELMAELHVEIVPLDPQVRAAWASDAKDPLTRWAAETLTTQPGLDLDAFLEKALDRTYSASPYEQFFTGGGLHTFANFDKEDNGRTMTIREGLRKSVNMVFIRLMRDLVRFHTAQLPYDARAVVADHAHPERQRLLHDVAERESRHRLWKVHKAYRGKTTNAAIAQFLGTRATSPRHLAIAFFAWYGPERAADLGPWLEQRGARVSSAEVDKLVQSYGKPTLTPFDYGYLLNRHMLDVWAIGQMVREPDLSWDDLLNRSGEARQASEQWLFGARARRAQNLRLRIRIEEEAFERMTPYWQRLGFPFKRLVPTYATAIGSSADRPAALAELIGIIVNNGVRKPTVRATRLHAAEGTPYETVFEPAPGGERVMEPAVASALKGALAEVVAGGTARRVYGAFRDADGKPLVVGGKTGSGDNRFKTFTRWGAVTSSRAINRTATFAFFLGDRYFGVLTAVVPGREAEAYSFTSALPLSVLKLAAPTINARIAGETLVAAKPTGA